GLDHQQGDALGVEAERGGQQQAGHGGEDGPDDPGPPAHGDGVGAGHRDQVGVVDHAAHGHAEAHHPEEVVQDPGRHHRDDDDGDLVEPDVDAQKADGVGV